MTKASDNVFPKIILSEGAAPATPAAGTVVQYAKADGLLYSKDDAGVETVVTGGGSGGAAAVDPVQEVFGAPTTAYEFGSTSLVGLTAIGTPDVENAHTTIPGHYFIADDANTRTGRYAAAPAAPWTAITKIGAGNIRSDHHQAGLFLGQATPGTMDYTGLARASRVIQSEQVNVTTFLGSIAGPSYSDVAPPLWLALRVNTSTDTDHLVSFDGYIWHEFVSARNPGIVIGSVGLIIYPSTLATRLAVAFDYLRIWTSALTFPGVV